jgi:hypothetical protein
MEERDNKEAGHEPGFPAVLSPIIFVPTLLALPTTSSRPDKRPGPPPT